MEILELLNRPLRHHKLEARHRTANGSLADAPGPISLPDAACPSTPTFELIGECWIEPIVSRQAVEGYDEKLRPVLARKPLEQAENNYAEALLL